MYKYIKKLSPVPKTKPISALNTGELSPSISGSFIPKDNTPGSQRLVLVSTEKRMPVIQSVAYEFTE
jgi:hypothetical protein